MNPGGGGALGAARASVGAAWVLSVTLVALVVDHPIVLGAAAAALVAVSLMVGCGRLALRTALFVVPLALTIVLVNALLSRDGLTVIWRLGEFPFVGRVDITAEALAYGAVLALRALVVAFAVMLFAACVDQDEVVGLLRRRAGRFGLVSALAARMVPLLAADGRRMVEARRAMPDGSAPSRAVMLNSLAGGALDRASDAAAVLELRGLGTGPCLAPARRSPWTRHDLALAASVFGLAAVLVAGTLAGWIDARFLPSVEIASGTATVACAGAVAALIVLPFAERRGVPR